jgi:hypothetical protein
MAVSGTSRRTSTAARSPSSVCVGGMRTSTMAISGRSAAAAAISPGPSPTVPTTWKSPSASSRSSPARSSTASSAITTRMAAPLESRWVLRPGWTR